jgi:hypothetical protein
VPTYLTRLHKTDPADRHNFWYLGLDLPPATLDFMDAYLEAGEIAFNVLDADGGVISFNGIYLQNTEIRFCTGRMNNLLILLWRLHVQPGSGAVCFERCSPRLLLSDNMCQDERARLGDLGRLTCYEINDTD